MFHTNVSQQNIHKRSQFFTTESAKKVVAKTVKRPNTDFEFS